MNRLRMVALAGSLSLCHLSGAAEAQSAEPAPPPLPDETGASQVAFGVSGFAGIPLGDFGDLVDFGLGALLTIDYGVQPQLELTGRAGFIYFVTDSDFDITFYDIPFWFGARYILDPSGEGVYLHGEFALNSYHVTVDSPLGGSASDSETEVGVNLLAGTKLGKLKLEGGLYIGSLDESSDTMMIGATGGTTF